MADTKIARLSDRGVLGIRGEDAQSFLQGLVTNDMDKLSVGAACFAALLTPQGKILFDFFVVGVPDGYLLDIDAGKATELAKRLGFYKLRARVEIADLSDTMAVNAAWGGPATDYDTAIGFDDPRIKQLGRRFLAAENDIPATATPGDYHAHRIGLGIPEGGKDYDFGAAFPHEVNMDALHGVDFEKGCYVGQEVVSRMHHKSKVRKRIVPVSAATALPDTGTDIRAGKALIGSLGSIAGSQGLALIRLDRATEAIEKGDAIMAGDVAIDLHQPEWAKFLVPQK